MIIKSLITARGGSKSVPKKNIIMLKDKPLIAYSILASLESKVSETWVSTDDEDIKSVSKEWGAKVIDRPKELATDTILNEPSLIQYTSFNIQFVPYIAAGSLSFLIGGIDNFFYFKNLFFPIIGFFLSFLILKQLFKSFFLAFLER